MYKDKKHGTILLKDGRRVADDNILCHHMLVQRFRKRLDLTRYRGGLAPEHSSRLDGDQDGILHNNQGRGSIPERDSIGRDLTLVRSRATDLYNESYGKEFGYLRTIDDEESIIDPTPSRDDGDTEGCIRWVLERVYESGRYRSSLETDARIEEEMEFFVRSGNITFIKKVVEMIDKFREDGVVWGVGRGSSCSSYLMFVLGVNDVNPLLHDIPFYELSKEVVFE